jgi:hypothetical protein
MTEQPQTLLPDYLGGSIVNLMASLITALGGEELLYPPLRLLPPARLAQSRNVVLLVIDGLGHEHLTRADAGVLRRGLLGPVTSVFPSTTATAITTFLTGSGPQQHALPGWHTYFKELGSVVAVLPFRARHGGPPLGDTGIDAGALFGHVPVFNRIRAQSFVVAPERIVHSDYNTAHTGPATRKAYNTLREMFATTAHIVRDSRERTYVYAYWPELDRLAHEHGIGSREAAAHLTELDKEFGHFLERIQGSDSTVIVTADHGFVDADPDHAVELDAHPKLAESLLLPLCGERRAAYCYVHPDRRAQFEDYVQSVLAAEVELIPSAKLIERGYFGLGPAHPRLHERIGDYTLVMRGRATIKDWLMGERRYSQVGVHGGVSAAEMRVPLVVADA